MIKNGGHVLFWKSVVGIAHQQTSFPNGAVTDNYAFQHDRASPVCHDTRRITIFSGWMLPAVVRWNLCRSAVTSVPLAVHTAGMRTQIPSLLLSDSQIRQSGFHSAEMQCTRPILQVMSARTEPPMLKSFPPPPHATRSVCSPAALSGDPHSALSLSHPASPPLSPLTPEPARADLQQRRGRHSEQGTTSKVPQNLFHTGFPSAAEEQVE